MKTLTHQDAQAIFGGSLPPDNGMGLPKDPFQDGRPGPYDPTYPRDQSAVGVE